MGARCCHHWCRFAGESKEREAGGAEDVDMGRDVRCRSGVPFVSCEFQGQILGFYVQVTAGNWQHHLMPAWGAGVACMQNLTKWSRQVFAGDSSSQDRRSNANCC